MVLGDKDYLDPELKQSYSSTGASHILAVSGLHVGVVFVIFNFLFSFLFRGGRRTVVVVRSLSVLVCLWLYAVITGLSASVLRATVMFSMIQFGLSLNRKANIYNTLCASALLLLFFNPYYLFDVSFQLSYAAVFSIVFFQPRIVSLIDISTDHWWGRLCNWVWSLVAVSLAAQIGTAPIVLYYFHQFSFYFWLSGLWVVPLSAVVIYLTFAFFLFSWVPYVSSFLAMSLAWVVGTMNAGVRFIERLPFAVVNDIHFGLSDTLLLLFSLSLLAFYLRFKSRRWLYSSLSLLLLMLLSDIVGFVYVRQQRVMAVYDIKGTSAVNMIGGGFNSLYCRGNSDTVKRRLKSYWVQRWCSEPVMANSVALCLSGRRTYVLSSPLPTDMSGIKPIAVYYLVVSHDVCADSATLASAFTYRRLILDSSNSAATEEWWQRHYVHVYDVSRQGAFVEDY